MRNWQRKGIVHLAVLGIAGTLGVSANADSHAGPAERKEHEPALAPATPPAKNSWPRGSEQYEPQVWVNKLPNAELVLNQYISGDD